jgi:hypothetical protein
MQFVNTLRRFADRITRKMTKYDLHLNRAKQTGDVSHNGDYSYHDDDLLMHEQQKDAKEAPRVKIDAVIAAPQIIIPRSARTDEVVVMRIKDFFFPFPCFLFPPPPFFCTCATSSFFFFFFFFF